MAETIPDQKEELFVVAIEALLKAARADRTVNNLYHDERHCASCGAQVGQGDPLAPPGEYIHREGCVVGDTYTLLKLVREGYDFSPVPIPGFATMYQVAEFIKMVGNGGLSPSSGRGCFATATHMVSTTNCFHAPPDWATHVAWMPKW